jgi:hypothetical protein
MYAAVPTAAACGDPVPARSCARTMPMSATITVPWGETRRFSGFRSRWARPRTSATARTPSTVSRMPATCGSVSAPTRGRSAPGGASCMASHGIPSVSPPSSTWSTSGCWSEADSTTSEKRFAAGAPARKSTIRLSATSAPSPSTARATYTTDIPPRPSSRRIS